MTGFESEDLDPLSFKTCVSETIANPLTDDSNDQKAMSDIFELLLQQGTTYYETLNDELTESFNDSRNSETAMMSDRNTRAIHRIEDKVFSTNHGNTFTMSKSIALAALHVIPMAHHTTELLGAAVYAVNAAHYIPSGTHRPEKDSRKIEGWDNMLNDVRDKSQSMLRNMSAVVWPQIIFPNIVCSFLPSDKKKIGKGSKGEIGKLKALYDKSNCANFPSSEADKVHCNDIYDMLQDFHEGTTGQNNKIAQAKRDAALELIKGMPVRDHSPLDKPHVTIFPQERMEVCEDKGSSYFGKYRERVASKQFSDSSWNVEMNVVGGGGIGCMLTETDPPTSGNDVTLSKIGTPIVLQVNLTCKGEPSKHYMALEYDGAGKFKRFRTSIRKEDLKATNKPGIATMMFSGDSTEIGDKATLLPSLIPKDIAKWNKSMPKLKVPREKICQTGAREVQRR